MTTQAPVLFLSHGSPVTAVTPGVLGEIWAGLATELGKPAAALVVSAHWNTRLPMLTGGKNPPTLYDFTGFAAELYRLRYPAPGQPGLAESVRSLLGDQGITAGIDGQRGLDHGAWIPLRFLFPNADVPVIQLSVQPERCARHHLALGRALQPLREKNILILASGHMTHNLMDWSMRQGQAPHPMSEAFRNWANRAIRDRDLAGLLDWEHAAPGARFAHPTPEHLLPLFVALGAAGDQPHVEALGGGWLDGVIAADNYRWN